MILQRFMATRAPSRAAFMSILGHALVMLPGDPKFAVEAAFSVFLECHPGSAALALEALDAIGAAHLVPNSIRAAGDYR